METPNLRHKAIADTIRRARPDLHSDAHHQRYLHKKISDYFGENVFIVQESKEIPQHIKRELKEIAQHRKNCSPELIRVVADAVIKWATAKGATHFCHWFQPLTGSTAEKHDAFLNFDGETLIEQLNPSRLIQGEPDASSFPNGGSRSTFEARGITAWDFSSPMFIVEGELGKILYIPTSFLSYSGSALDQKTPMLRSLSRINDVATQFLNLIGHPTHNVQVNIGAEQEYFLIDKNFYYLRPDLVMTGRTLFGSMPPKNQQLEDHYFGPIHDRILAFMQDLEIELYRLGIPAQTRHNEVAPGQFELAPIFREANVSADQNHIIMAYIKKIALKHNLVALLHEKPFSTINGSGKHLNYSLADSEGHNLLSPGDHPQENLPFLAMVSIITEAFHRHCDIIRASIADYANDFRLGGNEAPPSIMSIFLGEGLCNIFESICQNHHYSSPLKSLLPHGINQLPPILQDNTDRNRTSPFAFTGNKFEFRAVGSAASIGPILAILNTAISEVFVDSIRFIEHEMTQPEFKMEKSLRRLITQWYRSSQNIIFNGDGYQDAWRELAVQRKLPIFKNTLEALRIYKQPESTQFLIEQKVYGPNEIEIRHNVALERFCKITMIELKILFNMVEQFVIPSTLDYKGQLLTLMEKQKNLALSAATEERIIRKVDTELNSLYIKGEALENLIQLLEGKKEVESVAQHYDNDIVPLMQAIVANCNRLEVLVPDSYWKLPKYFDMLYLR